MYFIFILYYRNDVRPKANPSNVLFHLKMCCKEAKASQQHEDSFVSGTANENTAHWEARKSENEMRTWKMRGIVATVTS